MSKELKTVFSDCIVKAMSENDKIVSVSADLDKGSGLWWHKDEFPGRILDVGIAEQNMAGVAAGLAAYGMTAIINTFAPFATRRACDQIAISICYADRDVKIIGLDPGITAEHNGGTHMTFEDIGVLRSIPNITIMEAADALELEQMLPELFNHRGPAYLRMSRKVVPDVHKSDYKFEYGKSDMIKEGKDLTIFASGIMVATALEANEELLDLGIDAEIINIHTIKPIDMESILNSVNKTGVAVTAENHNILGGLRSAIAEVVTEHFPIRIFPVGVNDIKGEVGKMDYLSERFKLTSKDIVDACKKAISSKN